MLVLKYLYFIIPMCILETFTLSMERNPVSAKNQTLRILQSIYSAYECGIISFYSNGIMMNISTYLRSLIATTVT